MKNIHILSTDNPSRLVKIYNDVNRETFTLKLDVELNDSFKEYVNVYITSDEEIKEWDFSFYIPFGVGKNIILNGELCFHIEAKNFEGSFTQRTYQTLDLNEKIILTTDQDLINDGIQVIDGEFLEWFVKNPSCEEVEVVDGLYFDDVEWISCYKIIIPKEESKQETLEEAAEKYAKGWGEYDDKKAFITGAKWQQEQNKNLYSKEQVKRLMFDFYYDMSHKMNVPKNLISENVTNVDEWFKQFKKK